MISEYEIYMRPADLNLVLDYYLARSNMHISIQNTSGPNTV